MRRRAILEKVNDALGLGREVRYASQTAMTRGSISAHRKTVVPQQGRQRRGADAGCGAAEEVPAGEELRAFE
jgi:hypothetical protein